MLTQKMKAELSVYKKTSQWSAITEKSDEQKDMKVQSVEKKMKSQKLTKNLNVFPKALKSFSLAVKLTLLQKTTFSIQCVEK